MSEHLPDMKNPSNTAFSLTQPPATWHLQLAVGFVISCVLLSSLSTSAFGQDDEELPATFGEVIAAKQRELKKFAALKTSGPPEKTLASLARIVALHRQALKVAIKTKDSDEEIDDKLIKTLRDVFFNDSEFLSNQLFLNSRFEESAVVSRELEKSFAEAFGKDDARCINQGWSAVVAEKLAIAPKETQTAYLLSLDSLSKADQARSEGKLDMSAELYKQVLNAMVAVLGESHPKVALVANSQGVVEFNRKNYDEAERFYKQAIRIRMACNDLGLSYATTRSNLGLVYFETKKYSEAEKHYLAAAAIRERELDESNPSYVRILQQLAILYENSEQPDKLAGINERIAAAAPLAIVLRHLPNEAFATVAMSPSSLPGMAGFQLFPFEVLKTVGLEEFGVDPMSIESVVAFATLPADKPPLNFGILFRLKSGIPSDFRWLDDMTSAKTANGSAYRLDSKGGPQPMCFFEFDDGVLFYGCQSVLEQTISSDGTAKLIDIIRNDKNRGHVIAAMDVAMVTPTVKKALSEDGAPPIPPQLKPLLEMPADTQTIRGWLNMSEGFVVSLILDSTDQIKANRNATAIRKALEFAVPFMREGIKSEILGDEPMQVALRAYSDRVTEIYFKKLQPQVIENSVLIKLDVMENQMGAVAFALLLPAVQAARAAANRVSEMNRMKQVGLAMHNYHDVHKSFPARASYDKAGKPLLSWRVHLLPYLEEDQLYSQFKLDEPWDSPANIKLATKMPECYRNPNVKDTSKTVVMTPNGEGTFMEGKKKLNFGSFLDGTSNTIMLVEADSENARVWTQPADLPFDPENPNKGIGLIRPEGFHAVLVDGSVRLIPPTISAETLRRLIIRNDGKIVDF